MIHFSTILVADAAESSRKELIRTLEKEGWGVQEAALGRRLLDMLAHQRIDLILLDTHLLDMGALELIQQIRQCTDAPIITLSNERNQAKTISGLYMGADDHLTRPLDTDELIARITAMLRRYKGELADAARKGGMGDASGRTCFGGWILDHEKLQIVSADGLSGELTAHEFLLLNILISNAGKVLKRRDLCEAIRQDKYIPTPRAIDLKIMRIRKKIGDDATHPQMIRTIRGAGYMFDKSMLTDRPQKPPALQTNFA